jgi:iron complex transport system ATP-binding protein
MIEVKNLLLNNDDNKLLCQLSLTINKGEFWAILGKNGTGKTTLLKTLAGFLDFSKGNIMINGQKISDFDILSKAQHISYLSQSLESSLNCSIEESVSYGRYPWHTSKKQINDDTAVTDKALKDMDLYTIKHKNIQQISGGELRKVEIATVLSQDSEIMMLDEPLNHLDLSFRFKLMQLLKQLSTNKTILMVTHDIQYVHEYCTHGIMLIEENQPIFGKISDIMTTENINKMLGLSLPNKFLEMPL